MLHGGAAADHRRLETGAPRLALVAPLVAVLTVFTLNLVLLQGGVDRGRADPADCKTDGGYCRTSRFALPIHAEGTPEVADRLLDRGARGVGLTQGVEHHEVVDDPSGPPVGGSRGASATLGVAAAELAASDLPGRRERQLVQELELTGVLVGREAFTDERLELVLEVVCLLEARRKNDVGLDDLASDVVG